MLIAEIAQAHDGSLGTAHAYIDAVARTGADAIKFQTHIAAAESSPLEPWRVQFSYEDASRYDYWKRMEFTAEQWAGLKRHAEDRGLVFLSSPFSIEAVDLLERLGVSMWKIASGEVNNPTLMDAVLATGKPLLLSTGMSSWIEIDEAMERIERGRVRYTLLQCTSKYPVGPDEVGLNMLEVYRKRYACPVGLSDHSGTIWPSLAAVTLGASVIEVHVVFSRECFGPDVAASVTTAELSQLADGIRFIRGMRPVDKDAMAVSLADTKAIFEGKRGLNATFRQEMAIA